MLEKDNIRIPWLENTSNMDKEPKTRTKLLETRKLEKIPHISYDLDKDGFVGGRDYILSKRFDRDQDGRLNEKETKEAYDAIHNSVEDLYMWNLDKEGKDRKVRVLQKRGKIVDDDNFELLKDTYPKHPLSSKIPAHESLTKLVENRKINSKLFIEEKMKKWEEANPIVMINEPLKYDSDYKPQYNSVLDRKRDEKKQKRINHGLTATSQEIDPIRKNQEIGLDYVYNPQHRTRKELMESKKQEALDHLKKSLPQKHKDEVSRMNEREDEIFAKLYANNQDRMSLTKLKEIRKNEMIDYNTKTFSKQTIGIHGQELPKYSEHEEMKEYWKLKDGYLENPDTNSHVAFKQKVKYWKKPEELLLNEHLEDMPNPDAFKKVKILKEKKDDLIIKVNKLNHFKNKGFDPDNPKPIDIEDIKRNHIYKWSTLVVQFAPQKFKKGRFFDSIQSDPRVDVTNSLQKKENFVSEHMKGKKSENIVRNDEKDWGTESLYGKYSTKDTFKNDTKNFSVRTKAF